MSEVGKAERVTQNRVIALFRNELGYDYLGDWEKRSGNRNIEEELATIYLETQDYTSKQISTALFKLQKAASIGGRDLYGSNKEVYGYLRYGIPVKVEAGKVTETLHLIDWENPQNNDFGVAEEVTLRGGHERRPDLVLYVNGIAVGVIELKNSRVSIGEGIRQLISNQTAQFNEEFFTTVQYVFAGNDTEGLQYGTTGTSQKYFLKWKEDEEDNSGYKLDKYLKKMCSKERLIELMYDFVLFDAGVKKVPRVHQYFGIKAGQEHALRREGGIIWHTQGSGKSIVMVLLAKWILENNAKARVAIVTDRDELDKQIKDVFIDSGETIHRSSSGRDLLKKLGKAEPRLLCSLVHKFGSKKAEEFEAYIKELESSPSKTVGEVYVFVDECHRTQSGKLNRAMKAVMPNAIFMGFTGTPLLKKDKQTTMEVFGRYIHTYKFSEAVDDKVVLDLMYEARDIDQELGSDEKIDIWFETKTKGLNAWQRDELKKRWGTMQKVLSSKSRMERIVRDVLFDFSTKRHLSSEKGNAILVSRSIYEACKFYELFRKTTLKNKCAVVTSYNPQMGDISKEDIGADSETDKEFVFNTYTELLVGVSPKPGKSKTETYEDDVKDKFKNEPANMQLLIVVDKLLTGFDAPPCTYLYIDKSMKDHGLFQAICRTNRLNDEDKDFGYIVDYRDLFKNLVNDKGTGALQVYTSDLDDSSAGADPQVLLKDRLKKWSDRLDGALEKLALLCEPVEPPKSELDHIHYFCGNTEIATDLEEHEPQRVALYQGIVGLVRSYANIANELDVAGYDAASISQIKSQVEYYVRLRDTIRQASGESLDLKPFEADMRFLIDTYIEAKEPRKISPFDNLSLMEIIVSSGIDEAINRKLGGLSGNRDAVAETIENNVRSKIVKEHLNDPAFYETMSELLEEIIRDRHDKALEYEEYLKKIAELASKVEVGHGDDMPDVLKRSSALRALYNNLVEHFEAKEGQAAEDKPDREERVLQLAVQVDETVRRVKPDGFKGNQAKEAVIKEALLPLFDNVEEEVIRIFQIIKQQAEY